MLGHWHAQQRNIRSAREKRFLGIIGIGHANVVAEVQWVVGPPQQLRLKMTNARLAPDAADARDAHAVGDVAAIRRAVNGSTAVSLATAVQAVQVNDITIAELAAIGLANVDRWDQLVRALSSGPRRTGRCSRPRMSPRAPSSCSIAFPRSLLRR